MSKGGGKTQTVTQTTNSAPWAPQQEYLKEGFKRAGEWFNDSETPSYYPESSVIPFSPQTEQALRMAENKALGGTDPLVQRTTNLLSGVAGGQWVGSNPANAAFQNMLGDRNAGLSPMQSVASGQWVGSNPASGTFESMIGDRGTGLDALKATSRGDMLQNNPHLDGVISRATEALRDDFSKTIIPGLSGAFGRAGRVGSNSHAQAINDSTETLAEAMSQTAGDIAYSDYARERANQLSASERLTSDGASAAGSLANLYSGERAQQLNAADTLMGSGASAAGSLANLNAQERNQQLAAGSQLPALSQHEWDNINRLAAVGSSREQLAQAQLQDKIGRFNFEQQKEQDKIGQYLSLVGGGYGTSGSSSQPYFYNPASNILSGATGGAALANMMKVNPLWGAAAGGILGAF